MILVLSPEIISCNLLNDAADVLTAALQHLSSLILAKL